MLCLSTRIFHDTETVGKELLKNSRALIVLEPQSLKNEMIAILKDMLKGYQTGEDYSGEGKGYDADT
jgi:hypothetical protein